MRKIKTAHMAQCGMFAALSAILSQIMLPIGPVPITLTHVSIYLSASLLGAKRGMVSQIVYVLLGAVGLPVFSGMKGGVGVLFGPTGGFIIGYICCAFITGFIIDRWGSKVVTITAAMLAGITVTYSLGLIWFILLTKAELSAAFAMCVLPFLPGDALKILLCVPLTRRLRPIFQSGGE